MNNYTCDNCIDTTDFCCINHFAESIIEELFDTDKDFSSTSIIANGALTQDLVRLLLSVQMDDDDYVFHIGALNYDSVDYDKEYVISINTDHEIWCEPAYHDNQYGKGYVWMEANFAYIFEDSDFRVLDSVNANSMTIFGFDE